MLSDIVIPKPQKPVTNKQLFLKTVPQQVSGQASMIIKAAGLNVVRDKLLIVDSSRMAEEQATNEPNGAYSFDKKNTFGLPIFDVIVLKSLSYTDFQGNTVNLGDFILDLVLVQAFMPREIVTTEVTGRDGHVHEYMSDGDWNIKLSGVLINPLMNTPPETLVRALAQFCRAKKEIEVTSTLLSYLDIFSIIIVEPHFNQRKAERNAIDFELNCLSDTPFELK